MVDLYIERSGPITYTKTSDRSVLGHLNTFAYELTFFADRLEEKVISQPKASYWAGNRLVSDGQGDYFEPYEALVAELTKLAGKEVIRVPAVQIKVALDLEKAAVWRRLVVPMKLTFKELHTALQISFGWLDYHLYAFFIYDEHSRGSDLSCNHPGYYKEGYGPILEIVSEHEELYERDLPVKLDFEEKIADYLSEHKHLKYLYDYGDYWQHYIEVEQIIFDYNLNYPQCLAGEGKTPPEDVGGDSGYSHFLEVMADPKASQYKELASWAKSLGYQDFDLFEVNKRLRMQLNHSLTSFLCRLRLVRR